MLMSKDDDDDDDDNMAKKSNKSQPRVGFFILLVLFGSLFYFQEFPMEYI